MTTTPVNIDYNGIQINSQNKDVSITFTMDGTDKGIIFEYDKNTTPKTFKIALSGVTAGMYYNDGATANFTSLEEISLLQTLLSSLVTPPNSTTLSIDNAIGLKNGAVTATLGNTGGNLNINVSGSTGQVVFNQVPSCGVTATNATNLTNKAYVDNIYNIVDVNVNANYYPVFVAGAGAGVTLNIDSTIGPFSYNPSNGNMQNPALILDNTTNNIRMGSGAQITGATWGTNNIALGTNTGQRQGNNCIALGQFAGSGNTAGATGQSNDCIAIGQQAGRQQSDGAIAIGAFSGLTAQGPYAIAIGERAGSVNQGLNSIAIGNGAGQTNQGAYSIAIGASAGSTNQPANSIVINGTSSATNAGATGSCVIRPIRAVSHGIGVGYLRYDPVTFEITYSDT